jgi:hypothetical protein
VNESDEEALATVIAVMGPLVGLRCHGGHEAAAPAGAAQVCRSRIGYRMEMADAFAHHCIVDRALIARTWREHIIEMPPAYAHRFIAGIQALCRRHEGARVSSEAWDSSTTLNGGEWMLTRAFEQLGRECVLGHCDPANRSAAHCLRVLGFAPTGLVSYEGREAAQFLLHREHWHNWHSLPRRER